MSFGKMKFMKCSFSILLQIGIGKKEMKFPLVVVFKSEKYREKMQKRNWQISETFDDKFFQLFVIFIFIRKDQAIYE